MAVRKPERIKRVKDFLGKNEYCIAIVLMNIVAIAFIVFYTFLEGGLSHDGP